MADMIEKVTKGLECHKNGLCQIDDKTSCPYWGYEKDCSKHLMGDALELLKEKQPRVLSYKEVMESDFVFIELFTDEKDCVEPEFIRAIPLFISYTQPDFVTQYETCGHGTWEEYMYNWRCWTAIPTEEQRKAEPWKDGWQE